MTHVNSLVRMLLIVLVAVYLFFSLAMRSELGQQLFNWFILQPQDVLYHGQLTRLLTYGFLHVDPFHLIFNGLLLFFIGPQLEDRWGSNRFGLFIILTIIGGGLFVCAAWMMGVTQQPVIGFSSASLGLLIAWALTYPSSNLYLFGLVAITGKNMMWITVGLEVLYAVSGNNISSAAHFGGMATGAVLTLGLWRPTQWKRYLNGSYRQDWRRR